MKTATEQRYRHTPTHTEIESENKYLIKQKHEKRPDQATPSPYIETIKRNLIECRFNKKKTKLCELF